MMGIEFGDLNSHVTVYIFKFCKTTKTMKQVHVFPIIRCGYSSKKSCQRILHLKICEKKQKLTCRKVLKYLLVFDQESKRQLLNLISANSIIKNNNVYAGCLQKILKNVLETYDFQNKKYWRIMGTLWDSQ